MINIAEGLPLTLAAMAFEFTEGAHSFVYAEVDHTLDSVGRVGCGVVPKLKLTFFLVCLV